MLKKEINIYLIFITAILTASCSNDTPYKSTDYVRNNFHSYSNIYSDLNDSITLYVDSLVGTFRCQYIWEWQVDSMLAINSKKDLLFTSLISNSGEGKGMTSDAAQELMGKKINGKWYFFTGGGTLAIIRDMLGKDEMHPFTFYELSQIARKNMLESALIKKDGEYVVDDEWIDRKFYNTGYGLNLSRAEYDSVHWMLIMRKWKEKIDTNEYKPLKKNNPQQPNI